MNGWVEVNGAVCDPLRLRFYLINVEEISVNLSSNEFREFVIKLV